jgi:hypothetical protein
MNSRKTGNGSNITRFDDDETILRRNIEECPFFEKIHEWASKNPGLHIKSFSSATGKNLAALARKVVPGGKHVPTTAPVTMHAPAPAAALQNSRNTSFNPSPMSTSYNPNFDPSRAQEMAFYPDRSQMHPSLMYNPQMQPTPPSPHTVYGHMSQDYLGGEATARSMATIPVLEFLEFM